MYIGYWQFKYLQLQIRKSRLTWAFVFKHEHKRNINFVIQPQTLHKALTEQKITDFLIVSPELAETPEYKSKRATNMVLTVGLEPAKVKHMEIFKSGEVKRAAIKRYCGKAGK